MVSKGIDLVMIRTIMKEKLSFYIKESQLSVKQESVSIFFSL